MVEMDIVIPLANEPANHTLPLVLRSLARHAPQLRVVLVGHVGPYAPPFNQGDFAAVGHTIDIEQAAGDANGNTDRAMRAACADPEISDPFIWSNDDIYWRRPVSLAELLRHSAISRGPLPPRTETARGMYARLQKLSGELLTDAGLPTYDYERHVPILVHKDTMLKALALGGSKRSVYGNLINEYPVAIRGDVKLFKATDKVPDLAEEPFLSTGNAFPLQLLPAMLGV
jgi:hypothetical protein